MHRVRITLALALLLAAAPAAQAQINLLDRELTGGWITIQRPFFKTEDGEESVRATLADLGIRLRVSEGLQFVAEVPLVHVSVPDLGGFSGEPNSMLIGNPYIGIRAGNARASFDLGARPPLVSDEDANAYPAIIAVFADFDRLEAYLPKTASVRGALTAQTAARTTGPIARLRFGATAIIPTGEGEDDAEVFADYGIAVGAATPQVEFLIGANGRARMTNSEGQDFGERSVHQATASLTWRGARVRPTVFVRVPMDDDLEALRFVVGVGVMVGR